MIEIAPNTYRLGSNHHNFYVVTDGSKATVADAGCSKEWPKLEDGAHPQLRRAGGVPCGTPPVGS